MESNATSEALIKRFGSEYQQWHRISDARCREQCKLLREFADSIAPRTLAEGTREDLYAFASQYLGNLHVNTIRKKLNMIRPFYSWAYAAGVITADHYMSLKTVEDPRGATNKSTPRPYSPEEVAEFWAALEAKLPLLPKRGNRSQALKRWIQGKGPFYKVAKHAMRLQIEAIVYLALDGALRREEIFKLSVDDAHYDNAYVVVEGAQKGENFDQDTERVAPFTTRSRKAMYEWIEFRALMRPEHERLWVTCYGPLTHANPMSEKRFNELLWRVLGVREGVGEAWQLHRFRHTSATEWLRAGAALQYVSELLGHSNLQQTKAYTKIVGSDIERELGRVEENFSQRLRRAA